jgi:hypothetical protein
MLFKSIDKINNNLKIKIYANYSRRWYGFPINRPISYSNSKNFVTGNILYYRDGNNNNNANLTVNSVVGPTKYKVTRTA